MGIDVELSHRLLVSVFDDELLKCVIPIHVKGISFQIKLIDGASSLGVKDMCAAVTKLRYPIILDVEVDTIKTNVATDSKCHVAWRIR